VTTRAPAVTPVVTRSATPAITVAGYSHVAIMVDDLEAALAFYCDTLGFSVLPRPDFGPGTEGAWLQLGTAQVHLGAIEEVRRAAGFPHLALHVPTDAWDDTMAGIEARGIEFLVPPSERVDFGKPVLAAFIRDPAGNVIELTDVDPN
jgi:catechol 2,3-dioxygenase-like lactoylglutathione lyase family enzyme